MLCLFNNCKYNNNNNHVYICHHKTKFSSTLLKSIHLALSSSNIMNYILL